MTEIDYALRNYEDFVVSGIRPRNLSDRDLKLLCAMGMNGEAGEVSELYKKSILMGKGPVNMERLVEELGDVFWYFTLTRKLEGIPMREIIDYNYVKLKQRYG